MNTLPGLLLASVATLLHALLMVAAPLLAAIADGVDRALSGRTARPLVHVYRDAAAAFRPGVAAPSSALLAAGGLTVGAYLLVPSFATGLLASPASNLPTVAVLLVGARVMASVELGPAAIGTTLSASVLTVPALLLASLAASLIAGGTGIDAAVAGMPAAAFVPRALLVASLALAAVADVGQADVGQADVGQSGGGRAGENWFARLLVVLRFMVWIDLLAGVLPPPGTTPAAAGPESWLAALLLWPVKVCVLATAGGAVRAFLSAARGSWRTGALRAASLLALLSGVFVLIGQSLE